MPEIEDREDLDDEKPVIVQLCDGDLTAAEAESEIKAMDEAAPASGTKIMFKKPSKRVSKDSINDDVSSTKKSKKSNKKDKKLLSFDEEDDDNDSN